MPRRPGSTTRSFCRTYLEAARNGQQRFAGDVAREAVRRGLTLEECQNKVATENGVLIATALVGTAIGVGIACSNGCSGGGYSAPYYRGADWDCAGGPGDGPNYQHGPVHVPWNDPYDLDRDGDGIGCEAEDFGA